MARFNQVEICPWVSNVHLSPSAMGRVQPCSHRGQTRGQCLELLSHIKAAPSTVAGTAAGPTWLCVSPGEREDARKSRHVWVTERERASLFPWGDSWELVQNNQSMSPASVGFGWVPTPSWTDRSLWSSSPPSRWCPQQSGTGGRTGPPGRCPVLSGFRPLGGRPLQCGNESKCCSFLAKQAGLCFQLTELNVQFSVLPFSRIIS